MIETEHNGYRIIFSENEEVWRCGQLNLEAAKLSTLKTKMAKAVSAHRKTSAIEAYELPSTHNWHGKREIVTVKITMLAWPKRGGETTAVWTSTEVPEMWRGELRQKVVRSQRNIADLIEATPESARLINQLFDHMQAAKDAQAVAYNFHKAIPRLTVDWIKAAGADQEQPAE